VFNPARDGDCLMRRAVKHDFGGSGESAEAASDGGRAEAASGGWQTVGSAPAKRAVVVERCAAPRAALNALGLRKIVKKIDNASRRRRAAGDPC
jgi:hypothetical protein